jgi:hypothetical protein
MAQSSPSTPTVEYYLSKTDSTVLITASEEKEIKFYSFRLIFTVALAIVLYGLVKWPLQLVLPIAAAVYVLLEVMNYRLISKFSQRKPIKSKIIRSRQIQPKAVLLRGAVYMLIGLSLAATVLIQSNFNIETNQLVILAISGVAVYNGGQLIYQHFQAKE